MFVSVVLNKNNGNRKNYSFGFCLGGILFIHKSMGTSISIIDLNSQLKIKDNFLFLVF